MIRRRKIVDTISVIDHIACPMRILALNAAGITAGSGIKDAVLRWWRRRCAI